MRLLVLIFFSMIFVACSINHAPAPVRDAWYYPESPDKHSHTVRPGETLYAIAWRYDKDYRDLAQINRIKSPYTLSVGQKIKLKEFKKVTLAHKKTPKPIKFNRVSTWNWPTRGQVIKTYSEKDYQKGIDISGKTGQPVLATSSGRVAYSGNGLHGYGNLIIIKHNDEYLSAYAHNKKLLVKEGQSVAAGQAIATMGNTDSARTMLHFEIRKAGKPVDPLNYLPKRRKV